MKATRERPLLIDAARLEAAIAKIAAGLGGQQDRRTAVAAEALTGLIWRIERGEFEPRQGVLGVRT